MRNLIGGTKSTAVLEQCFNSLGRSTYWQEERGNCIIGDTFCCTLLGPLYERKSTSFFCFDIFHIVRQGVRFFLPDYTTSHSRRTVVIFNVMITLNHLDLSRNRLLKKHANFIFWIKRLGKLFAEQCLGLVSVNCNRIESVHNMRVGRWGKGTTPRIPNLCNKWK
jgi:hypothetical protein